MKKVKITEMEFYHFLNGIGNGFYDFYRTSLNKDGKKIYGTAFKLTKKLTDDNKRNLLQWKNVKLFIAQMQYAPEIKSNLVFIADKCI